MLGHIIFLSIVSSIVCFLLSRAVGLILSFVVFATLNTIIYFNLVVSSAGGWIILLLQIPAAFFGFIALILGAATKPEKLQTQDFPYPEIKPIVLSETDAIKLLKAKDLSSASKTTGLEVKIGFDKTCSRFYILLVEDLGINADRQYFEDYALMERELFKKTGLLVRDFSNEM